MKHESFDVARPQQHEPVAGMSDEELGGWLASLPPCPGIPSTDEEVDAAVERARADVAAGRVYPHAVVGEWLKTWGSPDCRPFQEWLAARDG